MFEDFKAKVTSDKALANEKGYNISTADLEASLSDEALDAVAGGCQVCTPYISDVP